MDVFSELGSQLDALCFAAGKGGCGLPESNVSEPDVAEGTQLLADFRDLLKEGECFLHRHFENVGDAFPAVGDVERFPIVAAASAVSQVT